MKVIFDVVPNHVGDYLQGIGNNAHYLSDATGLKAGTQLQPVAPFNNVNWYHNLGDINFDLEHPHTDESTQMLEMNIPVRQHRKSGRRETVCPGLRKLLMRVYSRNVLSKP